MQYRWHAVLLALLVPLVAVWYQFVDWWIPVGTCVAISSDGRFVAAGFRDYHPDRATGIVDVRDQETGQVVLRLGGVAPLALAFSPDSSQLAVGRRSRKLEIWSLAERRRLPLGGESSIDLGLKMPPPANSPTWVSRQIGELSFSPDGETLAVILSHSIDGQPNNLRGGPHVGMQCLLLDPAIGRVTAFESPPLAVAATTDGRRFAICLERRDPDATRHTIQTFYIADGRLTPGPLCPGGRTPVILTPDDRLITTVKSSLHIWDLEEEQPTATAFLGQHPRFVRHAQASVSSVAWVSASRIAEEVSNGPFDGARPVSMLEDLGIAKSYCRVAFSTDGQQLAGVSQDGKVSVWDPATGKRLQQYRMDARTIDYMNWLALASFVWLGLWILAGFRLPHLAGWHLLLELGLPAGLVIIGLGLRVDCLDHIRRTSHWELPLLAVTLASQSSIWTTLVVLSDLRWTLRAPAVVVMVAIVWAIGFWIIPDGSPLTFFLTGGGIALANWITLLTVAWIAGLDLAPLVDVSREREPRQISQVTLVELMLWTGAVAAAAAAGRNLTLQDVSLPELWRMQQLTLFVIAIALPAIVVPLTRRPMVRYVSLGALLLACGSTPLLLFFEYLRPPWSTVVVIEFAGMVLLSALLLRLHGYALQRTFRD